MTNRLLFAAGFAIGYALAGIDTLAAHVLGRLPTR